MKRWMVLVVLMLFCCGCSAKMTEEAQQKAHFVKASLEIGDRTPEERALIIKTRLKQIDGIIGTGVVVEGHTAIIGLRLAEDVEDASVIKRRADGAARNAGVSIDNTSVTTNTYIVSLIEEMERERAG